MKGAHTMGKRLGCLALCLLLAAGAVGCAPFSAAKKQTVTYMDVFDTVTTITAYGVDKAQFDADVEVLHAQLAAYHRLYDIYTLYPDTVNLKTVNDAAGGAPVAVDGRILDLLDFGQQAYALTEGRVNILFGAVLGLWHDSRTLGLKDPAAATLPDKAALAEAALHCDMSALVVDRAAGTVQLTDAQARLDVGAIAKGYVAERVAQYAADTLGWSSALLNVGGNIRAIGGKEGGNTPFAIGIQNPDTSSAKPYLATVKVQDKAVVTSGDYQRFYTVDGVRYAHIIDPSTLYPATYARAVSVVCEDSGLADVLSTALFVLPVEQGQTLLKKVAGAQAMWVLADGNIRYSDGFEV